MKWISSRQWLLPLLLLTVVPWARAEGPTAADCLPDSTVAYLSIADSADFAARLKDTSIGQMLQDEQVRPLYEHMYGSLTPVLEQFQQQVGVSVDDVLKIPDGELSLAIVAVPALRPCLVVMMDAGEQKMIDQLLDRGATALSEAGFTSAQEEAEGVSLRVFSRTGDAISEIVQLQLEKKVVITSSLRVAQQIVGLWKQTGEQTALRQLDTFQDVLAHCQSGSTPAPLTWYVDPIGVARAVSGPNPAAIAGLALLPAIGLDGLRAVAGTVQLAEEDFESLTHTHVLLDQPRDGVIDMIALKVGSGRPETWVPADTANYISWHWDVQRTFDTLTELFDSFRGEGTLARQLQRRFSDPLGVDVQAEILPAVAGRFTRVIWYERPVTLQSRSQLFGIKLNDAIAFRPILDKIIKKFPEAFETRDFGGTTLYALKQRQRAEAPVDGDDRPNNQAGSRGRGPQLTLALVGDYLLLAERPSVVEQAILAERDTAPRLRDELDYQLIADRINRHLKNQQPSLVSFHRPEEMLRALYELLRSDEVRQQIHDQREQNPFLRAVDDALQQQKLPAFPVIAKYFAPSGALLINEETGLHFIGFALRRQATPTTPSLRSGG